MSVQTVSEQPRMNIDVVSDVMCPWCFIGKRRLDRALVMAGPELETEVRWRPFQLDPTIPPEGMDRHEYLDNKFGREKAAELYRHIREVGEMEGIPFAFDLIEKSPNTLDAHRLIRWASPGHQQNYVVDRLFELYFLEGEDIGDPATLVDVAREADMDADLVADTIISETDVEQVEKEIALARELGVEGVPTFVIANKYMIVGAQQAEVLADAILQISQTPEADEDDEENEDTPL
jgi:predicted DsbA family dithiol-disulfide isomerase